jgi:hypothetical protein
VADVPAAGRSLWAALHLLDRQILDRDGISLAKVDDLEFSEPSADGDLPVLTDILCGQAALARRFGRRLGRGVEMLRRVIQPTAEPGPARISFGSVTNVGVDIRVSLDRDSADVTVVERWLEREVLSHLPGSGTKRQRDER